MTEPDRSTPAEPFLLHRACLYVDGCGTPIGIGRSWAAARASAVATSSGIDVCDPERDTPEKAAAWGAEHALDDLEPCEVLVRTERELLAVLRALGVDNPERELTGPPTVVRVGDAVLRFGPAPHDPPNPGVVSDPDHGAPPNPHTAHLEAVARGEGEQGAMDYQQDLAAWLLGHPDPLDRLERYGDEVSRLGARILTATWEARRARA